MSAVDPVLIGGAVVAIGIASAAAYATLTNGEAAVDVDGDGDDDIVFGDTDTEAEGEPVDLSAGGTADVSGSTGGGTSGATLEDVIVHDDLQAIDGVGPAREEALVAAEFRTIESISEASPAALQQAEGIGLTRAASIKQAAAEYLADSRSASAGQSDSQSDDLEGE